MLVEDDDLVRRALTKFFETNGFVVLAVPSVRLARRLLDETTVDYVITDHGLPDGSSADVLEAVQRRNPDLVRRGCLVIFTGDPYALGSKPPPSTVPIVTKSTDLRTLLAVVLQDERARRSG